MAKKVPDGVLDAAFNYIAESDLMTICSQEPATYEEATSTYKLADVAMSSGSYTKADDVSGRKITIGIAAGIPIDSSGNANHIVLVKSGDQTIRLITTCTEQALTAGGTVDTQAFKYNIQDPS